MKFSTALILLFLVFFQHINAQELIELEQIITYPANENSTVQKALLPKNSFNLQQVLLIEFSQEPFAISKIDGNSIAQFQIEPSNQPTKLVIRSTILRHQYDFETAVEKNKNKDLDEIQVEELENYLKPEKTAQVNSRKIQAKAKEIGGKSQEEIVRNIFDFVVERMTYVRRYNENPNAKNALTVGRGNYLEYCELMISLCRAKGIPARIVMGLANPKNVYKKDARHNWVEVYFKKYGWVTFDPTFADCYYEKKNCLTTFEHLNSKYIDFAYDRLIRWDTSAAFCTQWLSEIDYTFSIKYLLKENFKTAKSLYNNGNYNDALILLDSFINMGFHPLNYHQLKTKILCNSGDCLAASQSLHLLEKRSEKPRDIQQYLFLKAVWYAYQEDYNNTYALLNKWKEGSPYKGNIVHILKNEKAFNPINQQPEFQKLLEVDNIDYYRSFSHFGRSIIPNPIGFGLPTIPMVKNPTEETSSLQQEIKYVQVLAKTQNVKYITVTNMRDKLHQLFEFDNRGNQIYFFNLSHGWEAQYDASNRKVSHLYFRTRNNKIKPTINYFYEYENDLVNVLFCKDGCKKEDARLLYRSSVIEAGKKWKVEEFNETGEVEKWIIYTIDNQNRLIKMEGIQYDESITINHIYDDTNHTMSTQLSLNGNSLTMAEYEFTTDGKILSQHNPTPFNKNLTIKRYEYDEFGRLDLSHTLHDTKDGFSATTTYSYSKEIYLKKKSKTSISRKRLNTTMEKPRAIEFYYSYEFW